MFLQVTSLPCFDAIFIFLFLNSGKVLLFSPGLASILSIYAFSSHLPPLPFTFYCFFLRERNRKRKDRKKNRKIGIIKREAPWPGQPNYVENVGENLRTVGEHGGIVSWLKTTGAQGTILFHVGLPS